MMTVDEYVILVVDDSSDTVSMLNDALDFNSDIFSSLDTMA